ncbi:MAG TPA: SDR family NAD(P)-dependent oxidoreductase [Thermoanaerobaculia bacterium]|nr:SDR family NAD(P)-dependent oxidoreductase [Thermoanaerobaculia bacterium]
MELAGNTVLVTGGASGIGLALAERFLRAGSEVIICGRREAKLREAQEAHPQLVTRVCDVAEEAERRALLEWVVETHPGFNVLVNNAGIQRYPQLVQPEDWALSRQEIAINIEAPFHLSTLFVPHLLKQQRPSILNVTSGLAFVPMARAPIYSATKAALHSFTLSLRHQLAGTPIEVIEIIPPAVNTDLGGPGLHTFGVPLDEFADAVVARLEAGDVEIPYGFAAQSSRASREELDEIFTRMNQTR